MTYDCNRGCSSLFGPATGKDRRDLEKTGQWRCVCGGTVLPRASVVKGVAVPGWYLKAAPVSKRVAG